MANHGEPKKKGSFRRSRYQPVILAVVLVLIVSAISLYIQQRRPPLTPTPTVEINMTAKQFMYDPVIIHGHEGVKVMSTPLNGQFSNTTIMVNKGDRVILHITSLDIPHGFGIYEYQIFVSIPVGETITIEFVAERSGRFLFYCTVFCGTGHPNHVGTLIVREG